jgi:hypothetical protein
MTSHVAYAMSSVWSLLLVSIELKRAGATPAAACCSPCCCAGRHLNSYQNAHPLSQFTAVSPLQPCFLFLCWGFLRRQLWARLLPPLPHPLDHTAAAHLHTLSHMPSLQGGVCLDSSPGPQRVHTAARHNPAAVPSTAGEPQGRDAAGGSGGGVSSSSFGGSRHR